MRATAVFPVRRALLVLPDCRARRSKSCDERHLAVEGIMTCASGWHKTAIRSYLHYQYSYRSSRHWDMQDGGGAGIEENGRN